MFDFWSGWITHLETMVVEEEGILVNFSLFFCLVGMNQCLVVKGVKWCKGFYRERSGVAFSFFLLEFFCVRR